MANHPARKKSGKVFLSKEAAQFKGLFSPKYMSWIKTEVALLAANNWSFSSVEEANANIDKAIKELAKTIQQAIEPELTRIISEEREDILEDLSENVVAGPNLPQMGPSTPAPAPTTEAVPAAVEPESISPPLASRRRAQIDHKKWTEMKKGPTTREIMESTEGLPDLDAKEIVFEVRTGMFDSNLEAWLNEFVRMGEQEDEVEEVNFENDTLDLYNLVTFDVPVHVIEGDGNDWELGGAILHRGYSSEMFTTAEQARSKFEEVKSNIDLRESETVSPPPASRLSKVIKALSANASLTLNEAPEDIHKMKANIDIMLKNVGINKFEAALDNGQYKFTFATEDEAKIAHDVLDSEGFNVMLNGEAGINRGQKAREEEQLLDEAPQRREGQNMETWDDIETLEKHGWAGEPWVAYFAGGAYDVVMGFGQTYDEALESARSEGLEQGAPDDTEYNAVQVGGISQRQSKKAAITKKLAEAFEESERKGDNFEVDLSQTQKAIDDALEADLEEPEGHIEPRKADKFDSDLAESKKNIDKALREPLDQPKPNIAPRKAGEELEDFKEDILEEQELEATLETKDDISQHTQIQHKEAQTSPSEDLPDLEATEITFEKFGPGKYSSNLDAWLDEFSLNGMANDELGDAENFGHYSLVLFETPVTVHEDTQAWQLGGAIVGTNDQGFVNVDTFDTAEQAEQVWSTLQEDYAQFLGEFGEEGEEDVFRGS